MVLLSYNRLSLQKKLLVFMMSMVIFFGGITGVLIRSIIFPRLVGEMEARGAAVAHCLAEISRHHILAGEGELLEAALVHEKASERLIAYILVEDQDGRVLAHTFQDLEALGGSPKPSLHDRKWAAEIMSSLSTSASGQLAQLTVPVNDGTNRIGLVRLGFDKGFIAGVLRDLSLFHVGFVGLMVLVGLVFGHYLSRVITRPIASLTRLAGEISSGNLNTCIITGSHQKCWDIMQCQKRNCPVRSDDSVRCWFMGCDAPCHSPSGSDVPILDKCKDCRVYRSQAGDEITQLIDAFNHMTRRLRASEAELRLSEERYRLLFNHDPHPVFVVEPESHFILDTNERATQKYGYTRDEFLKMKITDLGFDEDSSLVKDAFSRSGHADMSCSNLTRIRHRKKDGAAFWVNITFCKFYEHTGSGSVITTMADITEIVETEARLIQAGKMATLGEMSTGIAHELSQPLNAIKLGSEFLQSMVEMGKVVPKPDLFQVARDMSKEVDRAAEIINHLREFGRKSEIVRHRIDVNVAIKGALTLLGQQLRVHGIEVVLEPGRPLPAILANENRLEQVLINLINNARDSIDARWELGSRSEGGILAIKSYVENDQVVLTVADNGTGIPLSIRDRVFEPFFTTKAVGKGTGLGLSISYGIVRDYQGMIDFETEEGEGTVFKLTFPKAPEET